MKSNETDPSNRCFIYVRTGTRNNKGEKFKTPIGRESLVLEERAVPNTIQNDLLYLSLMTFLVATPFEPMSNIYMKKKYIGKSAGEILPQFIRWRDFCLTFGREKWVELDSGMADRCSFFSACMSVVWVSFFLSCSSVSAEDDFISLPPPRWSRESILSQCVLPSQIHSTNYLFTVYHYSVEDGFPTQRPVSLLSYDYLLSIIIGSKTEFSVCAFRIHLNCIIIQFPNVVFEFYNQISFSVITLSFRFILILILIYLWSFRIFGSRCFCYIFLYLRARWA